MSAFDPTGGYDRPFAGPDTPRDQRWPLPYKSRAQVVAEHVVAWRAKKGGVDPTPGELAMSTGMCRETCKTLLDELVHGSKRVR